MPPRHTYWTIILEGKPTAFRAHTQEELLPTLRQLQAGQPDAVLLWFAGGRLWKSEEESREALSKRGPPGAGRGGAAAQGGAREAARARASKSRGTRRDVAFASGCSETRFPRIAKPRGETASRNGRRGRRRARIRHVRTRRARSQTGARGPRMDGRRVKPIDRRGRTARRISVQGKVLDRRTENPAGNQIGPRDRAAVDRGWKPSRPGEQRSGGGSRGNQAGLKVRARRRRSRLETKPASGQRRAGTVAGNQVDQRVRER